MTWLLFVDEPSDQQRSYPYGVLSGIAVEDLHVWPLARKLRDAQDSFFGRQMIDADGRYTACSHLLDSKVYESAALHLDLDLQAILRRADRPRSSTRFSNSEVSAAVSQAKIAYCDHALALARDFGAQALAMFLPAECIPVAVDGKLRKDYGYLLERFYHLLKTLPNGGAGLIVLPRQPRGRTYVTVDHVVDYFSKTTNGRIRAQRIISDPVYAAGALTVVSHLAEVFSYVASWSVRLPNMLEPRRPEMGPLTSRCSALRYSYVAENGKKDWSFKFIGDLNPGPDAPGIRRGANAVHAGH